MTFKRSRGVFFSHTHLHHVALFRLAHGLFVILCNCSHDRLEEICQLIRKGEEKRISLEETEQALQWQAICVTIMIVRASAAAQNRERSCQVGGKKCCARVFYVGISTFRTQTNTFSFGRARRVVLYDEMEFGMSVVRMHNAVRSGR